MVFDLTKLYVYDIETYKDCFSFSIVRSDGKHKKTFSCNRYQNQVQEILKCLKFLKDNQCYMVGFNNLNFDYPVIHELLNLKKGGYFPSTTGLVIARKAHEIGNDVIHGQKNEQFGAAIKKADVWIPQIDLLKVHHFDNKNRRTSLKDIEFNMRLSTIQDLPFPVDSPMDEENVKQLLKYNEHDVEATRLFLLASVEKVKFRFELTEKHQQDFLNYNDGKIGKEYFRIKLQEEGVVLQEYQDGELVEKQSPREIIHLKDCLFGYYDFKRPEFKAVLKWFSEQSIRETKSVFSDIPEHLLGDVAQYAEMVEKRKRFKGVPTEDDIKEFKKQYPLGWVFEQELKSFENVLDENGQVIKEKNEKGRLVNKKKPRISYWKKWREVETLNVKVDGFRFDFGVGGIHGSLKDKEARSTKDYDLIDADVTSMYPSLAISNNIYPEHLGEGFCKIYLDVFHQRMQYARNTVENLRLKLALNAIYGDSNNQFSFLYDPKYTMTITINGQLSLCLLAERLLDIQKVKMVQCNTDGLTVAVPKAKRADYFRVCKQWESDVKLKLEYADYSKMFIRDVNNYTALNKKGSFNEEGLYEEGVGKIKQKGAYEYKGLDWNKNHSSLVIPMAVEEYLLNGKDYVEFLKESLKKGNVFDFMIKAKVNRGSRLVLVKDGEEIPQQRICRYYPCKEGGELVKIMPPLEGCDEERRLGLSVGYKLEICNDMKDYKGNVDLDYYIEEVQKLLITES